MWPLINNSIACYIFFILIKRNICLNFFVQSFEAIFHCESDLCIHQWHCLFHFNNIVVCFQHISERLIKSLNHR